MTPGESDPPVSVRPREAVAESSTDRVGEPGAVSAPDRVVLPQRRPGPLGRDWQQAGYGVVTLLGCFGLLWVGWQLLAPISQTLVLFLLAAALAFVLASPVDALAERTGQRLVSIVAVYLVTGVVVVVGVLALTRPFAGQASTLLINLPRYERELVGHAAQLEDALRRFGVAASVDEISASGARAIQENSAVVVGSLVESVAQIGGMLVNALLILVISFYLLLDGRRLRRSVLAVIPAAYQGPALFVDQNVIRVFSGYLRGQVAIAASTGVVAGIGCALFGLPYPVVLGILAGLFQLVPMFGPFLSVAPAVLVALFQPFPTVVWVLLFFVAIQQVEGNIISPRITGDAVGLHPLAALFALLAGFQLAGVLGGLFAVPVAGILWALVSAAYEGRGQPIHDLDQRQQTSS